MKRGKWNYRQEAIKQKVYHEERRMKTKFVSKDVIKKLRITYTDLHTLGLYTILSPQQFVIEKLWGVSNELLN